MAGLFEGAARRINAGVQNAKDEDTGARKAAGFVRGLITGDTKREADRTAKTRAEMTRTNEDGTRMYMRNARGDIINRNTGETATTDSHGHIISNNEGVPDVAKDGAGIYANSTPTPKGDNDYTLQDIINEVGDDKEAVQKWINDHPGYEIGPKTEAYLNETGTNTPTGGNDNAIEPDDNGNGNSDGGDSSDTGQVVEQVQEIQNADTADEQAETLSDNMKSKRAVADTRAITRNLWQAYEDGEFGPKGSPEAKQARNYFILNELMTASQNWSKVEQNYIENLSRAAAGETIKATDTSNFEKSKFEQMRDNAMARMEQGKDDLHNADISSINEAADVETKQDIAQNLGPQGLAQAASTVQAEGGTFDALTNAMASGSPDQLQKVLDASASQPITAQEMNELQLDAQKLENKFNEQSFNSRLQGLIANNSMTQAQASLLQKKVQAIGGIEKLMTGLANGNITANSLMGAGISFAELKLLGMM